MCPWQGIRDAEKEKGHMKEEVWEVLKPHLDQVKSIDFTGGGEPLLQKHLTSWVAQAKSAGCSVGFLTNGLLLTPERSSTFIELGLDWIGFSIDGADKTIYEKIRKGADFSSLIENIRSLTRMKTTKSPLVMINFVILPDNVHQLETIVELAAELKVNQINFKQCDVIRGEHGKGLGLFDRKSSKEIKKLQKQLRKACNKAEKLGIKTTSFAFLPDEQPICDQNPTKSLFIRHDGRVSPCINLAMGGRSTFLEEEITFPTLIYGQLPENNLTTIWESSACQSHRERFSERQHIYDKTMASFQQLNTLYRLQEAFSTATKAMPEAPEGCRKCHYLHGI